MIFKQFGLIFDQLPRQNQRWICCSMAFVSLIDVERAFNAAGPPVSKMRGSLSNKSFDNLGFLRNYLVLGNQFNCSSFGNNGLDAYIWGWKNLEIINFCYLNLFYENSNLWMISKKLQDGKTWLDDWEICGLPNIYTW